MPHLVVGVDVGGTFTDLFAYDEATGCARIVKLPSTRGHEADGFAAGLEVLAPLVTMAAVVHGTTVGTNAVLERKGASAGLLTTAGFRDVLAMRRRDRRQTWGLTGDFVPVIPRDMRAEIAERTTADGTVLQPVDPAEVRQAAQRLLAAGAEALCIVFLHSYANPANERAALAAAREVWPNPHVAISSEILPEIREFERTSTAALNAVLQPVVGSYLAELETRLHGGGFAGDLLVVQSNGGVMSVETAARLPVRTALSGPAAGVIAAAHIAREAGLADVITGDVGGTSFDVSLISDGTPAYTAQSTLDFGLVVRTPMIEITTIGAGGGSVARIDGAGLLQVGPQSAGSDPGPVCYAAGGTRPTLTDANVVLGRIDAEHPIGGKLARLDKEAAAEAIARDIADPLGLDVPGAAAAIVQVATARMAAALRLVSVERGHDPKRFALMPFGGGGGLHAGALVREVGLAQAL
ncbi:MAG: hydantoinase/oxoprolinase family protein, partial [Acetobacteraceae bacterium]|nr:hydantoinase/oxoprolinase family protein [Acetobacteraceae bacterium]